MQRDNCRKCGVTTERVPSACGSNQQTFSYRIFLATWAKRLSWKETANIFGTSRESVYRAIQWVVRWGSIHRDLSGVEVPSRVVYANESLSNRADARDRQDVTQARATPAKIVRVTGAIFGCGRGVQQQSEIDHENSIWIQRLRNHHNRTISLAWQPTVAKTNPQLLRMRQTERIHSNGKRPTQHWGLSRLVHRLRSMCAR